MIQLTTSGPTIVKDDEWAEQQRAFTRNHWVHLRNFIAPAALDRVSELLSRKTTCFYENKHKSGAAVELSLHKTSILDNFLWLLLNQPRLFAAIQELTSSDRIPIYWRGRVSKMIPGAGHFISWHTDATAWRLAGLRVNLRREEAVGGNLQLLSLGRGHGSAVGGRTLQTIDNGGYGDATLFRIAPWLQHRVLPAQSVTCRYVGWFGIAEP